MAWASAGKNKDKTKIHHRDTEFTEGVSHRPTQTQRKIRQD